MKHIKYILLFIICFGFTNHPNQEFYPAKKIDEVKVFIIDVVDPLAPEIKLFSPDGQINSTSEGIRMNTSQINDLLNIINDTLTYGQRHSFSYAPSIGFVFYNKSKVVDWIELGFITNTLTSKKKIKAQWKYYEYYMGDSTVTYYLSGISNMGRNRFRLLLNELDIDDPNGFFSYWDSTNIDLNKIMRSF
jgi:hypothetical protein